MLRKGAAQQQQQKRRRDGVRKGSGLRGCDVPVSCAACGVRSPGGPGGPRQGALAGLGSLQAGTAPAMANASCAALWPAPACWHGHCVDGSCACDEGWELVGVDIDGAELCVRAKGVVPLLYLVWACSDAACLLLLLANSWLNLQLGWHRQRFEVLSLLWFEMGSALYLIVAFSGWLSPEREMGHSGLSLLLFTAAMSCISIGATMHTVRQVSALRGRDTASGQYVDTLLKATVALEVFRIVAVVFAMGECSCWRDSNAFATD
jgi:hypothetical protein